MQITCPRCSAKYEVPDAVMPSGGRDVQCSDCGHSWYQLVARSSGTESAPEAPAKPEDNAAAPNASALPSDSALARQRLRQMRAAMEQEGEDAPVSTPQPDPATEADEGDAPPLAQSPAPAFEPMDMPNIGLEPPQRRELDPAVAAVLRAEAEFERHARLHGPAQALEMQPELGLELPARMGKRSQDTVRDRLARLQAAARQDSDPAAAENTQPTPDPAPLTRSLENPGPASKPGARPENLRQTPPSKPSQKPRENQPQPPRKEAAKPSPRKAEKPQPAPGTAPRQPGRAGLPAHAPSRDLAALEREQAIARRSFRWGFALSLSLCLAAAALYLASPALAQWMPAQSDLFAGIARKGAQVHLNLAAAVQDWLARLGDWVQQLAQNSAA